MSRSRNIKPGFFDNETLVSLPMEFRMLFIGTWTIADREGRFEDRPTRIKMRLFPADAVDIDAGLQALHDNGFILRYVHQNVGYCQVLAWEKHQNPHFREKASSIPSPKSLGLLFDPIGEKPQASTGLSSHKVTSDGDKATLIPDSLIPDSLIPEVKSSRSAKAVADPEDFNSFWKIYPRKVSKSEAVKAFARLRPNAELLEKMLCGLIAQANTPKWLSEPQFIPHPATWLNGRRWEDDLRSLTANGKMHQPSKTMLALQSLQDRKYANELDRPGDQHRLTKTDLA